MMGLRPNFIKLQLEEALGELLRDSHCLTKGSEDMEAGCCRVCRARIALAEHRASTNSVHLKTGMQKELVLRLSDIPTEGIRIMEPDKYVSIHIIPGESEHRAEPSADVVERVARALLENANKFTLDNHLAPASDVYEWDELQEAGRDEYRSDAKAAIAAMQGEG